MRKQIMKKVLAAILASAFILSSVPVGTFAAEVSAAEPAVAAETLQVQFDQEYAEVGKELSVTVTGDEMVSYHWYIGGIKINNDTSSYVPTANDLEKMIEVVVISDTSRASASLYFSKLPVVYIDTNGKAITSKVDYVDATMKVQGNAQYNTKTTTLYDGIIEIRGRGNTTWSMPKKPYKLKLDKKTDMFGMGKNKHWVLLANYSDESLMRNTLAYDFSGALGMEHMSTVWTSVVLNGEYQGNYQFCEQVRVDDTRVDIFDWEGLAEDAAEVIADEEGLSKDLAGDLETYMLEENMGWITSGQVRFNNTTYYIADYPDIEIPDITGGYLLELDEYYDEVSKFKTSYNQPIMFKNPEFVTTNSDMMKYVQTYVQAFENAVRSGKYTATYNGKDTHYGELYDYDALVDYWVISEIFFNQELNKKSTYMYKEIDELMKMGPIWDMDYSSGGEGSTYLTDRWATLYFVENAQINQWYKYIVKDPYFLMKAQERYWEIRYKETADMINAIDGHYEYLKESGKADYELWLKKANRRITFDQEVNTLTSWFNNHITWLDKQMETEDTLTSSFYSASNNLRLSLADQEGNALKGELAFKAPADAVSKVGENIVLSVSGSNSGTTATVFVNSRIYDTTTVGSTIVIPSVALTEEVGEKNVIEVKLLNNYGNATASNYITVKQKDPNGENGVQKSALEELLYEAGDLKESGYTKDSWAVFEDALNDAYVVLFDNEATQATVDAAAKTLKKAMTALVEVKDPADASDDYDVKKITYSAGTSQSGEGIELAFDGNENTIWHSQYSPRPNWYGTQAAFDYFWVLFELEETTVVDAVRYLQRTGNGDILSYRVDGSLDGKEWIDLTEGDWSNADTGWKAAEFAPTELKYVRLWATATTSSSGANRHVSAKELRVRTSELPVEEPVELPYDDVSSDEWYYEYVQDAFSKKLMTGLNETTFGPAEKLTRAQFALILYRIDGEVEVEGNIPYPDVENNQWYTDAVIWATKVGVVTGYDDGRFGTHDAITRQQIATMMYRYAKYKEMDVKNSANLDEYADASEISDFALEGMKWCVAEGIISGHDGETKLLAPQDNVIRAECAAIISRYTGL